jgi:hypothetical protein
MSFQDLIDGEQPKKAKADPKREAASVRRVEAKQPQYNFDHLAKATPADLKGMQEVSGQAYRALQEMIRAHNKQGKLK